MPILINYTNLGEEVSTAFKNSGFG